MQIPASAKINAFTNYVGIRNEEKANEIQYKKVKGGVSTVHIFSTSNPSEIRKCEKYKYEDLSEEGDTEKMFYKLYKFKRLSLKEVNKKLNK